MYIEMRTYTLQCGKIPQFYSLYESQGLEKHAQTQGNLIGVFSSEIGELDQITYLLGYDDLKQRSERRAILYADPGWQKYADQVRPLITRQESKILVPASFSPLR
jgi:hypothetical protein